MIRNNGRAPRILLCTSSKYKWSNDRYRCFVALKDYKFKNPQNYSLKSEEDHNYGVL